MGRKPLALEDRKVRVNITVKKKYVEFLREKNINISQIIEDYVKNLQKE